MAAPNTLAYRRANSVLRPWSAASIAMLLFLLGLKSAAPAAPAPEYQLKAVFLFNFAQFVEWPQEAFPDAQTPLTIGVLGEDPFGAYLDATVRGETVNGRPLVVQHFLRVDEIKTCHILFISRSEGNRLEQILTVLKGRSILTVSDLSHFAARGGIVRFYTDRNKIRLRINVAAAKAASLTISSKLLRPAEIVTTGKD
jgi:hypothetical protein